MLLTLMLACLRGMFAWHVCSKNLHGRDPAVRYASGSVQLRCSHSCWHVHETYRRDLALRYSSVQLCFSRSCWHV